MSPYYFSLHKLNVNNRLLQFVCVTCDYSLIYSEDRALQSETWQNMSETHTLVRQIE